MLEFAGQEPPSSEAIGLLVAIIILLVAFGSIVAAGMPIVVALVGLTMGQMFVLVVANFLDVATFAPTLAAMIGLGVGIDYALFVMNRYRQALLHGREPKDAAMESVQTAGRAVLFAGSTVIIALLGLFVLGINFFNGLAVAAAVTVLMVMLSALWMLPALLSLLGNKALAWRLPWGKKPGALKGHPEGRAWAHYGRILQKKPIIPALLALAIVVVLAIPMLSLRQGFADDSGKPEGSPARIAYDLRAEGFGPGVNGPFLVVADLSEATSPEAYGQIIAGLAATEGVAGTSPSAEVLPILGKLSQAAAENAQAEGAAAPQTVQAIAVYPTTSPQDEATTELLERLRTETNPALQESHGSQALRRRNAGDHERLHDGAAGRPAAVPRDRRRPGLPRPGPAVPLPARAADSGDHQHAVLRRGDGHHGGGVPVGLVHGPPGHSRNRADLPVPADHGVRDPVRPVDGLPGVPGVPDAGGVAAHR